MSHASEDKERFARPFAMDLRRRGLDVWLDEWELSPGDSLVDKIFEEGLRNCEAVVIVLSRVSVQKRWVREELNASVVNRIHRGHRLIPIILDDVEVPEALKSTVWVRIDSVSNFEAQADRIVAAVFGRSEKPPIGSPPSYALLDASSVAELSRLDAAVLRLFGDEAVEKRSTWGIHANEREVAAGKNGIGREDYRDSLKILLKVNHLERSLQSLSDYYSITVAGFDAYLWAFYPDFATIYWTLARAILNYPMYRQVGYLMFDSNTQTNLDLAQIVHQPLVIVDQVLRSLESKGYIRLSVYKAGLIKIIGLSVEFKRLVREHDGA